MQKTLCLICLAIFMAGCSSSRPSRYVIPPPRTAAPAKPIALPSASLRMTAAPAAASATNAPVKLAVMPPARLAAPQQQPTAPAANVMKPALTTTTPSNPPAAPAAKAAPSMAPARSASAYLIKAGDPVVVHLRGIPQEQEIEDQVDETGYINLPFINEIMAAGKSGSELERLIRKTYIDQQIYRNIMVNVILPSQSYYVRGEVRQPGRVPLASGVTMVQAIAAAGGYTEFANSSKVQLLRGSKSTYYDVRDFEKHPEKDVAIEAGDVIVVHRSIF